MPAIDEHVETMHTAVPSGRVIDLTHVLRPGEGPYTLEIAQRGERPGPEGDVEVGMVDVGAHVEAPLHFPHGGREGARRRSRSSG